MRSTRGPDPHHRVGAIGSYWEPKTRTFAELLIDCEENRTLWAVLVGCCGSPNR